MNWKDIEDSLQASIVAGAAERIAADDRADAPLPDDFVSIADLATCARGGALRIPLALVRETLRRDAAQRRVFAQLLDHYAKVSVPLAAAASSGAVTRRRNITDDTEIEWSASSAEPASVLVRVRAPASIRPISSVVLLGVHGDAGVLPLIDEGEEIEGIVGRDTLEYQLLNEPGTKLWLR